MIRNLTLRQLSSRLGAVPGQADASFSSLSIDTRTLNAGDLFIAIKGPNFNGHQFVSLAAEKGAVAILVSESVESQLPQLRVADTREALGQIAAMNREVFAGKIFAVTGSTGKTTVKEMTASILRQCGSVLATKGNFNNDIGVPLTLLQLSAEHQFAVMELGASSVGEIAYTVALVKPDVAVITNAAEAHIEGFGSLSNIVQAKGEIIDGLPAEGTAIINSDDLNAYKWIQRAGKRKHLTFSIDDTAGADFYARNVIEDDKGCFAFDLVSPQGEVSIQLNHLGKHSIANALAASAAAMTLGADLQQIKAGLEAAYPVAGRLTRLDGLHGATVIDDTYNANPESLRAAVDVLSRCTGRKVLVLGDMAELGEQAHNAHIESGRYALAQGIDQLLSIGNLSAQAASVFGDRGAAYSSKEQLVAALSRIMTKNTTVLVKGSRSAQMEDVVAAITEGEQECS